MSDAHHGFIEERLGTIIVDGRSCEVRVRSEPDDDGVWHNALIFERQARTRTRERLVTGVEWHVPPGIALERARELEESERLALFERALRPRPPLM